ncbi:transporter substrate-binding domain-containing protein [Candidatus Gillettellia adelgis]
MKKYLIAAILAGVTDSALAVTTLFFTTEASYPPFEFIDTHNQIQGFDIDVANAVCKKMQTDCVFANQAFDSLILSLKFKQSDAVIACIDITPEREKQVLFTKPYYKNSALFITLKNRIAEKATLPGNKIGVQNGSTHQKYLTDKYPDITVTPYNSYQNAILDLKNGRLDAVFGDTEVVKTWLQKHSELAAIGNKVTDKDYFSAGLGIAVNKKNSTLQYKFNNALDEIQQDGTYKILYKKWFK